MNRQASDLHRRIIDATQRLLPELAAQLPVLVDLASTPDIPHTDTVAVSGSSGPSDRTGRLAIAPTPGQRHLDTIEALLRQLETEHARVSDDVGSPVVYCHASDCGRPLVDGDDVQADAEKHAFHTRCYFRTAKRRSRQLMSNGVQ